MALRGPSLQLPIISANGQRRTARPRGITMDSMRSKATVFEEGHLEHPNWSGETPLSRLVGALISFKPLYSVLKLAARRVMISTAEKNNIPWRKMTSEILESADVYKELESVQNLSIVYPDYYLKPFHAYDEGHLSWLAAAEVEPATMSMVMRAVPEASSLDEAKEVVFGNWLRTVDEHHRQYSGNPILHILDIGCSIGLSTRYLADKFPLAKTTGLDLSPYFLAVAQYMEKKRTAPRKNAIRWLHENGEHTSLPSQSFDLVSIAYLFHECPQVAIVNLLKESFRLLRPGGTIAITDNAPKSKITQELSPIIFTLLKSTEPYLDEYYLTDLEGRMREVGFVNVKSRLTDPRHVTVTATVPH
ncbi:uncharacterized protein LOC111018124 [Momordica charantia]|uniref:Uncharacterized protein LOC111018124 n=1 Tax=Momordica charantia TaxID=3673 RepID=A0A6J1D9E9_MOMCH|nr:uncharacterized protein LOC111018124 [Momordica charantia]